MGHPAGDLRVPPVPTRRLPRGLRRRVRRAHVRVQLQVFRLGDGVLQQHGHPARPRGVLHLLGMPRVGARRVRLTRAVHRVRSTPGATRRGNRARHLRARVPLHLDQLRLRSPAPGVPRERR